MGNRNSSTKEYEAIRDYETVRDYALGKDVDVKSLPKSVRGMTLVNLTLLSNRDIRIEDDLIDRHIPHQYMEQALINSASTGNFNILVKILDMLPSYSVYPLINIAIKYNQMRVVIYLLKRTLFRKTPDIFEYVYILNRNVFLKEAIVVLNTYPTDIGETHSILYLIEFARIHNYGPTDILNDVMCRWKNSQLVFPPFHDKDVSSYPKLIRFLLEETNVDISTIYFRNRCLIDILHKFYDFKTEFLKVMDIVNKIDKFERCDDSTSKYGMICTHIFDYNKLQNEYKTELLNILHGYYPKEISLDLSSYLIMKI